MLHVAVWTVRVFIAFGLLYVFGMMVEHFIEEVLL